MRSVSCEVAQQFIQYIPIYLVSILFFMVRNLHFLSLLSPEILPQIYFALYHPVRS